MGEPQILRPFSRAEAISVDEAARIAGKSPRTIREWCQSYDIGRRIAGRWAISRIALQMLIDGEGEGLMAAYLKGDRSSACVRRYFAHCGVPLPKLATAAYIGH